MRKGCIRQDPVHSWGRGGGSLRLATLPRAPASAQAPVLLLYTLLPRSGSLLCCPAGLASSAPSTVCPWGLPPPEAVAVAGPQMCVETLPGVAVGAELGTAGRRGSPGDGGDGRVCACAVARGAVRQRTPACSCSGAREQPWTVSHPAQAPAGTGCLVRPGRTCVPPLFKKPEIPLRGSNSFAAHLHFI